MAGYESKNQTGYGRTLDASSQAGLSNPPSQPPSNSARDPSASVTHNGSYIVFAPDQQKRKQILQGAQRETELYEAHREQSRLTHVSESGIAGGSGMSEDEVRKLQQREAALAHQKSKAKADAHRADKKRREDEENQKIKDKARQKAEQKEQQDRERENKRRMQQAEEHKRKMDIFLSKLEGKPIEECKVPVLPKPITLPVIAPSLEAHAPTAPSLEAHVPTTPTLATPFINHSRVRTSDTKPIQIEDQLRELQYLFPGQSRDTVLEMLRISGYNMDVAANLLMG